MRSSAFARLLFFSFLLIPSVAHAQLFADSEARQEAQKNSEALKSVTEVVREVNARLGDLEGRNNALRKQLAEFSQQKQELAQQVRELRGLLEENQQQSNHQESQFVNDQRGINVGIEKTLRELSGQLNELSENVAVMQNYVALPDESELYDAAFDKWKKQDYVAAIKGFNQVLRSYPDGQFGLNASYWISKAYLASGEHQKAKVSAEAILTKYPDSDKRPETLLVVAQAMLGMGNVQEGKTVLVDIVGQYPTSLAADQARQLLVE